MAIYMPMVAELPIAMLACARIGAVHSVGSVLTTTCYHSNEAVGKDIVGAKSKLFEQVVFGGFSSDALAERILDCKYNSSYLSRSFSIQ